ncbi:type II secretion system F family protein [Planctomycetota bacterium]|nr:type II secretion system F family protein [Planctomycetota bacterium]
MAQFKFKARDQKGKLHTGLISALSIDEASVVLHREGKFIVDLQKQLSIDSNQKPENLKSKGKIRKIDVITFTHQLAVMIDTGVPLSEALDCVKSQIVNQTFQQVVCNVTDKVQSGSDFSKALSEYPKVFPDVMVSLIRASEASGTLGSMLERISVYMQKESQTAKKIKSALIYPIFMIAVAIAVTVFLLAFVLPRFTGIYESKGATLPLPTQILMSASGALINYWWIWGVAVTSIIVGLIVSMQTQSGRIAIDYLKIKIPIVGPLFNKMYITRGCRTMGTMLNAGVPILDMVEIVKETTTNNLYERFWNQVDQMLRRGSQLSDAMFDSPLIPKSVSQMIYSGEKSGKLGPVMEKIAEYTELEFDEQVKTTTQFIEPAMIIVMGGLVGFVAIALLLPVFSIGRVVSGG